MSNYIKPSDQMLVIEKLYRSTDAIGSTEKFNSQYGAKVGRIGEVTLPVNDFYRRLVAADFLRIECKQFIKEFSGHVVEIY
ncbi:MAG: hypothetical protein NUV82_02400 [Candidatus Komeilibacteria bacterium]|nr:hypothetical protein [Candidatus Komeilibacteria bacterium]